MTLALKNIFFSAAEIALPYYAIKSIYSKISLFKILDNPPPSMEREVRVIQASITPDLYQLMTEYTRFEELETLATKFNFEIINRGWNLVITLPEHPKYVLKSTRIGLIDEIGRFARSSACGMDYYATNQEGGISPCFFGLAERVAFSQRLRHIIKKHRLNLIKVPKKALVSFPQPLVPQYATPLHQKKVFVISKRYKIDFFAPMLLDPEEQNELVRQLMVFFEKAKGILDTHARNFCFTGKKLLFFDTEKFHLDPFCKICISTRLKETRIGLENMRRFFSHLPNGEGAHLVSLCLEGINAIRKRERILLISRVSIPIILVALAHISLQYLLLNFSSRIYK